MTRLYRTLLGIHTGSPVGTFAVTFTVKEWMLDPDNDFTDTEVDVLPYMTVKIDGVEQLTDSSGQTTFNLAPGTHTYEVYDMVRYLTTVKGEVTVVDAAIAVDVKIYACLYTPTQVSEMISVDGYIPVASAAELDGLRNAVSQTMGAGTIWESNYTTGLDQKYVQVRDIDLISYQSGEGWNSIGGPGGEGFNFTGIYSGNLLYIHNLAINTLGSTTRGFRALFGLVSSGGELKNINVHGDVRGANQYNALICGYLSGAIIENCKGWGYVQCGSNSGGLVGYNRSSAIVTDSYFEGEINITGIAGVGGGIVGFNEATIRNSSATLICKTTTREIGGIAGRQGINGVISYCHSVVDITWVSGVAINGGVCGYSHDGSTIRKSSASGVIRNPNTSANNNSGGIAGVLRNCVCEDVISSVDILGSGPRNGGVTALVETGGTTLKNAASYGKVTGTTTTGGLVGQNNGSVVNSYYDYEEAEITAGAGLPRTTAQMKAGTADSFINPDGTIDATQNPANAMYTSWDDTIWDFTDTNEYPTFL